VPLAGVTPASLSSLKALEKELEGVRFVNTTAEVAESLAHYRDGVFTALLITMGLIALLLTVRSAPLLSVPEAAPST
jgi:predicted exporter